MPNPGIFSSLVLVLLVLPAACVSGSGHENFKNTMQAEIGKNSDDRYAYRNHYRNLFIGAKELPGGNVEEGFRSGRGPNCRVYFEIDKAARKIVSWRYEGAEKDCVIVP